MRDIEFGPVNSVRAQEIKNRWGGLNQTDYNIGSDFYVTVYIPNDIKNYEEEYIAIDMLSNKLI